MPNRRSVLQGAVSGLLLTSAGLGAARARADLPQGTLDSEVLEALPGKRPLLKRSYRPPNYETPLAGFASPITPNDQFFVRWHLSNIPEIEADAWALKVGGESAEHALTLSLEQLKREFEAVEIVAVCQCAGNRRGYSDPHVPGVQWGSGAIGNARWKGVRLRDILARAGIRNDAVEVAFHGGDRAALDATPPFVKSLPNWKALEDTTLVAYEMNGAPLPLWNGFPARIVVPGWVATYWMKQVNSIEALSSPLKGFWMNTAYRIPKGKFPVNDWFPSQANDTTTPITEMLVNSMITSHAAGQRVKAAVPVHLRGVAWDGGHGIRRVDISLDAGQTWSSATLGDDFGRFSFRPWEFRFVPMKKGAVPVMARATNAQGATQAESLIFNAAGYHNNVIQRIELMVV